MDNVPSAYYDFVMQYAPYYYVIATKMAQDPPSGQKDVMIEDGTKFQVGYPVEIKDDAHSEWNKVASVNGNVLTMENNLQYTYYVAKNGRVEGPDPAFGRGAFPAAFAIDFLYEAYTAKQFESAKTEILNKIVELADFILTQQSTNSEKKAYGGFKNNEAGTEHWSVDAGRYIPPLLKAYSLTEDEDYLDAAILAGATFLYNMQHKPEEEGVHDKYYGGFAKYVTITDDWSQPMMVEDLYDLIGLKKLAETFDPDNKSRYETMIADAVAFLINFILTLVSVFFLLDAGGELVSLRGKMHLVLVITSGILTIAGMGALWFRLNSLAGWSFFANYSLISAMVSLVLIAISGIFVKSRLRGLLERFGVTPFQIFYFTLGLMVFLTN